MFPISFPTVSEMCWTYSEHAVLLSDLLRVLLELIIHELFSYKCRTGIKLLLESLHALIKVLGVQASRGCLCTTQSSTVRGSLVPTMSDLAPYQDYYVGLR